MSSEMRQKVSAEQIKAARHLLKKSQQDLADLAGVSLVSIKRYEGQGKPPVSDEIAAKIILALETLVEFIPENGGGAGVRLKKAES